MNELESILVEGSIVIIQINFISIWKVRLREGGQPAFKTSTEMGLELVVQNIRVSDQGGHSSQTFSLSECSL